MSPVLREAAILESVQASLHAEGYRVVVQPNRLDLPTFLQGMHPDAIAYGTNDNLVVEVVERTSQAEEKIRRYREAIEPQPDWKLRTIWISGQTTPLSPKPASKKSISAALSQIDSLLASGFFKPAMLLCWSALEAIGRRLVPQALEKPQTPARLVEQLATHGHFDRAEVALLKKFAVLRNQLVHGDLDAGIVEMDVREFHHILKTISKST